MVQAAAIYCRISSDPEGDRLGVTRQREDCEGLAARKGWTVREVYIDDDRSAYSGKPRPEYRRLLDDIDAHTVDGLLVYNLDRLHRQPRELEAFFDVCDRAGMRQLASVEGDVDLGSDDGRFYARIMGAVARKASDDTSRRIIRKNLERAMKGLPTGGGARPFGYRADRRTVDPGEAALVREATSRVLAGDAVRSIAADWNERGVTTTEGKPWQVQSLRRVLYGARISGQREYHGEIVADGVWEPIITPEQGARLRAILDERSRTRTRSTRRYLLTGLLRCGLCGATLVSRPQADGQRRYACATGLGQSGCGRIAIKAEDLEAFIEAAILARLDSPAVAAARRGAAEADELTAAEQASLARDRDQLDELARLYGERQVTPSEWLAARKPIEARIEATRRKLSRMTASAALDLLDNPAELRERWSSLPLDRQRAIVSSVLDRAVIRPAVRGRATFDAARIEPVWPDG